MIESIATPDHSEIVITRHPRLIALSRGCVLAALFFSPWILQWPILWPGLAETSVPILANLPKLRLADMLAVAAIALYAFAGWPGLRQLGRRSVRWWLWSLTGLAILSVLSITWAMDTNLALVFAAHSVLWIAFAVRVAADDLPPRSLALSLTAGMFVNSAICLLQFATQHSLGLTFFGELPLDPAASGISVIGNNDIHLLRVYGLSGHPNVIGGFMAVALMWSLGLIARSSRRWLPMILGAWLLGWLTLMLSFSRSAWLGIVFALGWMASLMFWRRVYRRYAGRVIAVVGIIVISILLLANMFNIFLIERLTADQTSLLESVSISERIDLIQAAVELIELRPLTGVGIGNFIAGSQRFIGPEVGHDWVHNVPLLIASEMGLPGVTLWLIGLAAIGRSLVRTYRRGALDMWQIAAACSIAAMLVIMQFDHYWWTSSQGVYMWAAITGWLMSQNSEAPTPRSALVC